MIFPGHAWQGAAETQVVAGEDEEMVPLKTGDGTAVMGLFGRALVRPAPLKTAGFATVVYFYGNGECIATARDVAGIFRSLGYHCMLVDYEGYGMSAGKPSERGCYDAAEAAYQHARGRSEVDAGRIVVAGWSLGGAVAIELARRHEKELRGLMTFSTFYSLVDFAQRQFPLVPVGWLLRHRFDSAEKVRHLTLPYFVGHGARDEMIPVGDARRLAEAHGRSEVVTRSICADADHCDYFAVGGEELVREVAEFLERVFDF